METDFASGKELDFNAPRYMDFNDANWDNADEDYFFGGKKAGTSGTSDSKAKDHNDGGNEESERSEEKVEAMVTEDSEDVETAYSEDVETADSEDVEAVDLKDVEAADSEDVETADSEGVGIVDSEVVEIASEVVRHNMETYTTEEEQAEVTEKVDTVMKGESEEMEHLEASVPEESDGAHPEDKSLSSAERRMPPNLMSSFDTELKRLGGHIPRQSPRLAHIAKALLRNKAKRRSHDGKQQSADNSHGVINDLHGRKNRIKNNSSKRAPQIKSLTKNDEETLASIAEIKHMTKNKKAEEPVKKLGPTKVKEFHFATDARIKNPQTSKDGDEKEFARSLRSNTLSQSSKENRGPTIPKPFNLTESHKTQNSDEFISMAEKNLKFFTVTPQRFRTKKLAEGSNEPTGASNAPAKLTQPQTPKLQSQNRLRGIQHPTREEEEQKELEEIQKNKFKAQPLNKKVFDPPASGSKVVKKLPTVPEPFNIKASKKYESSVSLKGMGARSESACSMPYGGVPYKWEMGSTKQKPFSFDDRDKDMMKKKEEKIQKFIEAEKKAREFQANPMPIFENGISGVQERKPQEPTAPKPFNFEIDRRVELRKERYEVEEMERHEEARHFKAQPCSVTHKAPFIPQKSTKPCTEISGFVLNTEERSKEREEFEKVRRQKEDELQAKKRELEEIKAAEEANEIARLRKEAVHKANPVRRYKNVEIKPSPLPPTNPVSPKFHTDKRAKSK